MISSLPRFIPAKLHKCTKYISYENAYRINKVYSEILGLEDVCHFSINIVNNLTGELSVMSSTPSIIFNLISNQLYKFFGTLSPSFYQFLDIYTFDQTYDPRFHTILKNLVQRKNGIKQGVVLVKKMQSHTLLYVFATKKNDAGLFERISNEKNIFYSMGDYCFDHIKSVYQRYDPQKFVSLPSQESISKKKHPDIIFIRSYRTK